MRALALWVFLMPLTQVLAAEKMVVLDVTASDPSLDQASALVAEQLLTELQRYQSFDVIGKSDIAVLLGVERQRQLLGCAEEASASCMAEIGAALGAPYMVAGALFKVGTRLRVEVKLLSTRESRALAREGRDLEREDELPQAVAELANLLIASVSPGGIAPVPLDRRTLVQRVPQLPWVFAAVGAVLAGGGGVMMGLASRSASGIEARKEPEMLTWAQVQQEVGSLRVLYFTGVAMLGVGAAAAVAATAWGIVTRKSVAAVSVAVTPGGGAVVLQGTW